MQLSSVGWLVPKVLAILRFASRAAKENARKLVEASEEEGEGMISRNMKGRTRDIMPLWTD